MVFTYERSITSFCDFVYDLFRWHIIDLMLLIMINFHIVIYPWEVPWRGKTPALFLRDLRLAFPKGGILLQMLTCLRPPAKVIATPVKWPRFYALQLALIQTSWLTTHTSHEFIIQGRIFVRFPWGRTCEYISTLRRWYWAFDEIFCSEEFWCFYIV